MSADTRFLVKSGAEEGQTSGDRAPGPSAYHTTAFLLEGVLVLRDAFEERVVSCFSLHIILDFLSCLGNLRENKGLFQALFVCGDPWFARSKKTGPGQGGDGGWRGDRERDRRGWGVTSSLRGAPGQARCALQAGEASPPHCLSLPLGGGSRLHEDPDAMENRSREGKRGLTSILGFLTSFFSCSTSIFNSSFSLRSWAILPQRHLLLERVPQLGSQIPLGSPQGPPALPTPQLPPSSLSSPSLQAPLIHTMGSLPPPPHPESRSRREDAPGVKGDAQAPPLGKDLSRNRNQSMEKGEKRRLFQGIGFGKPGYCST